MTHYQNPTTPEIQAHKDQLRLRKPPQGVEPAPATRMLFRGLRDVEDLVPLSDDDRPAPLDIPAGMEGNAERALARGDTAGAAAMATLLQAGAPDDDPQPNPRAAAAISFRVRALLMEGRLHEAVTLLLPVRDHPAMALADAAVSLVEGDDARCERRLEKALDARPQGIAELYTLALLRIAQGDLDTGRELLGQVCASMPEHAVARHQLGRLMVSLGDPARGGTLFEMAMEIAPAFASPALTLAEMFIESRQYGEAMNLLQDLAEDQPNLLAPRILQLRVLVEARRIPAAMQLGEALMQAAPGREDVILLYSEALLAGEQAEKARPLLESLLKGPEPSDPLKVVRMMARVELAHRPPRVDAAITLLEAAAEADPSGGELTVELAQLQLAARKNRAATQTLEKLMARPDTDPSVLLSGAVLAGKHGLNGLARKLGEDAVARAAGTDAEEQLRHLVDQIGVGQ